MKLNVVRLGRMDYKEALDIQEKVFSLRRLGEIDDTLLMVEHPPVLTIGRRGSDANIVLSRKELKGRGVGIYDVSRGGDVTYHGPGQIVGYPIMDLNNHGKDIRGFIYGIQEIFIKLLKDRYDIETYRQDKTYTGVWVGDDKITAIGIAVKRWITMHGFAFNVNTDLEHFRWIVPCGITDRGVTSLQKLLGHEVDFDEMNNQVIKYFCEIFDMECEEKKIDTLIN